MRAPFPFLAACLLLPAAATAQEARTEDERLARFVDYFLKNRLHRLRASRPENVQRLMFFDRMLERIGTGRLSVDGRIDFDILRTRVRERIDLFALHFRRIPAAAAMIPPRDFLEMTALLEEGPDRDQAWREAETAVREAGSLPPWLKCPLRKGLEKAHLEISMLSAMRGEKPALALALKDLKEHLAGLEPPATGPPRSEPTRRERYQFQIQYALLSDHTPESLLELGMRKYRETVREMERVARAVDSSKTWRELIRECRDECWDADKVHDRAKELAHRARDFAVQEDLATISEDARGFSVTPGRPGLVTPFGHYRGGVGARGAYITPPLGDLDEKTLEERLRDNNRYWTTIVALHEAVPGHHLQTNVAAGLDRRPIRRLADTSAYVEGWGLYSEEMMFRAGYYEDDSKQRLVALQMRLWRCARVIIDVGLQTGTITKEEAVDLLVHGVRMSRSSAELEVDHYSRRPTYFCGYLLGFLEFTSLRRECEKILGDRFDRKKFHDFLLNLGPLPLRALRKAVLNWARER